MFGIWGEAMQTQDVTKFDAFVEHLTDDYVCTNPMMVAAGVNMWECVGKDAMIPMMTKTFFEDKVSPIEFKPMVGLTACGPVIVYKNICDGKSLSLSFLSYEDCYHIYNHTNTTSSPPSLQIMHLSHHLPCLYPLKV